MYLICALIKTICKPSAGCQTSGTSLKNRICRRKKSVNISLPLSLRECPNTEVFLIRIFLYSVRIQENADQENLRIWTLFTQYIFQNNL